jgi:hypothetical protein
VASGDIEQDREMLKPLALTVPEVAYLCSAFRDAEVQLQGPFASLEGSLTHTDAHGRSWQVDTKDLVRRLNDANPDQRCALSRAVSRFWENYPTQDPGAAMRAAGFL